MAFCRTPCSQSDSRPSVRMPISGSQPKGSLIAKLGSLELSSWLEDFPDSTSTQVMVPPISVPGSWRSWFQQLSLDSMVLGLIMTNAAVFVLWRILHQDFMKNNFMISLDNFKSGRVHTLVTSAFSHVDLEHIISNMVGLYFFGGHIGRILGLEFLLKLYLAGAIGGSVFYLLHAGFMAMLSRDRGEG